MDTCDEDALIMGFIDSIMRLRESLCLTPAQAMRITERHIQAVYEKIYTRTNEAIARASGVGGSNISERMGALSMEQGETNALQANAFYCVNMCMRIRQGIIDANPEIDFAAQLPCVELPSDPQDDIRALEQQIIEVKETWQHKERRKQEILDDSQRNQGLPSFISDMFGAGRSPFQRDSTAGGSRLTPERQAELEELEAEKGRLEVVHQSLVTQKQRLQEHQTSLESQMYAHDHMQM